MLQRNITLILFLTLAAMVNSCRKEDNATDDCFPSASTVRQVINKSAIIKLAGGQFYIIEQGPIDTKVSPCNLTQEFQVDNLRVTVCGQVKSTRTSGAVPCCTENFVIEKITK